MLKNTINYTGYVHYETNLSFGNVFHLCSSLLFFIKEQLLYSKPNLHYYPIETKFDNWEKDKKKFELQRWLSDL